MPLFANKWLTPEAMVRRLSLHPKPEPRRGCLKPLQQGQGCRVGGIGRSFSACGVCRVLGQSHSIQAAGLGGHRGQGGPSSSPGWRGPIPRGTMEGGTVFQARAVAAGIESSSGGCQGGLAGCPGARGSHWHCAGLPGLQGERRLLRPHCGCDAGQV